MGQNTRIEVAGSVEIAGQNKLIFAEKEVKLLLEQLENDLLGHSVRLMLGTGLRV